jgi:dUTP pyrophosphatase
MINLYINDQLKNILNDKNIDVKDYIPAYNGESAGLDLYNTAPTFFIRPTTESSQKVLIPTGIKVHIPKGYVGLIQERGSITKTPLKVRAGVIDTGYTGEIFINCVNVSNDDWKMSKGQKMPFQLIVVKCDNEFSVISEEEYLNLSKASQRKEGMVGSSD